MVQQEDIYGSAIKTVRNISGDFERFMNWADERRTLKVGTNAVHLMSQNKHRMVRKVLLMLIACVFLYKGLLML